MTILGIETSCDETGIAIVKRSSPDSYTILSNIVASSLAFHAKTGGIIPEVASREQLKCILPTLEKSLNEAFNISLSNRITPPIDAIAVTYGPGLIGPLLIGVETAKTLSLLWNVPIIPVNHMHGHLLVNIIGNNDITLPAIGLVVSGGHTDLTIIKNHNTINVLGGKRDDAAGEAFDKIGRILSLPYPAGPTISQLAEKGDKNAFKLPRPMINSGNLDFSFSGLKTAVLNLVKKNGWDFSHKKNDQTLFDLCASVQSAIVDVIVSKTIQACTSHSINTVVMGGGVTANKHLRNSLSDNIEKIGGKLFYPSPFLCTDNGTMIAAAGFFTKTTDWDKINANPQLYY
ncbi:MAG: tRNA (adenosine(37)-N6)-threonylcarbamoyltransferase complex transferase subunit TsaD [Candidatus Levybacteria bacterium]|nr:tRNA (adenosine(37)-N6)-threonylcarbamoyltransferase complex transferase subunit TsaD [Candidatus Levybacteria bacterium]